jgi:hypoxanthine phosphoribosyltransferase
MTLPEGEPRILIRARRIHAKVRLLASAISKRYAGRAPVLVGILRASFVFMADLARELAFPISCEFIAASSYGDSTTPSRRVRISLPPSLRLRGRDVIVVETVIDSGRTLRAAMSSLRRLGPRSLAACALLKKPGGPAPEFVGFRIARRFVVGYGLDLAGRYRNLRHIAAW